ncbi:hypothetical protein [Spectribacter hydrogenoxidans]|uniref:DUF2336 domain-containing protein n=1 Tax=Spectribacter hydrogenoxidans TaxID=3075608 RepID=A0ABU3BZD2_9GAMM|nr:hypothetical protein [Salinisphaera sp. W335]MDT0634476.1 hypothetical protein [Salinisphaera sp. W335]
MPRLAVRAELQKLARLLDTGPEALDFLADRPAAELRQLREGVAEAMFKRHSSSFRLLASLSGLLPAAITARIAHLALGAFLAGRVTGEMTPKRAVAIAHKLPTDFLAETSLYIEPSRAQPVLAAMPVDMIEKVAVILVEQREFITMGRFVGAVSEAALFRVIDRLDDEALLHIGFYVEDAGRLDRILEYLDDDRLRGVIKTATSQSLWPEALSLVQLVGDAQKGRLGDLVAREDETVLDSLVHVAQEQSLWPEVLVAVGSMQPGNRQRVVNLPSVTDPAVLNALIDAAYRQSLWQVVVPLLAMMNDDARAAAVEAGLAQTPAVWRTWLDAAAEPDLLPDAVSIFTRLPERLRAEVARHVEQRVNEPGAGRLAELAASLNVGGSR